MITQIQRWRRFFAELAGSSPEAECETDRGWSIVFFFSNVSFQNIRIVSNIFSYAKWNAEATIYRPGMRCAGSLKARAVAGIAPGFRAEWRDQNAISHNSPCLARAWYFMDDTTPQIVAAGQFPVHLPASWSTSLTKVRAGKDEFLPDGPVFH